MGEGYLRRKKTNNPWGFLSHLRGGKKGDERMV